VTFIFIKLIHLLEVESIPSSALTHYRNFMLFWRKISLFLCFQKAWIALSQYLKINSTIDRTWLSE